MEIRKVIEQDVPNLKELLDSSELFPSEYLEEMISDYFNNPMSEDIWFTCEGKGKLNAIGYCSPEKFAEGTCNLKAIAVRSTLKGQGIGSEMMAFVERQLIEKSVRILIVETSSTSDFTLTRKFYNKIGYTKEATIRDFWNEGDDKIVFWKKLN